ncbi:sugar phosphate isomerase/epimerase family protein [Puia dinghuensis]|uniref:Xylose isomerase n=1 Tax=Puia dinghuensis TaxID=1792502 RepID=A0A8J2UC22_9BACT|nr:sugar phosphate isomerase/epimerase [Puia dinghuensis]GGA93897.1 xylose isomerase [Puia dinghuensis]
MSNRREFLKLGGAAALGSFAISKQAQAFFSKAAGSSGHPGKALHPIGLQLFTLFTFIDNDVPGNLKKVAGIGYKEIESAFSKKGGYYGMKPAAFAALVKDTGMSWRSHHVLGAPFHMPANAKPIVDANGKPITFPPMRNLRENMQQLVDEAAEGGIPYLVCANTPMHTSDEIKSSIETLNKTGEACKKAGITFCYHNHTEEFTKVDGETPYHLFLTQLSPDIKMELDLCWATKAGVDPVELFKAHPGRFPLWHAKDLNKERTGPAPVGTGVVDFKRIFDNAATAGMQHFFVEHDMPADAFASITTSYNNLTKILSA